MAALRLAMAPEILRFAQNDASLRMTKLDRIIPYRLGRSLALPSNQTIAALFSNLRA